MLRPAVRNLLERYSGWRSGPLFVVSLALFIVVAGIGTIVYNDRSFNALRAAETKSQAEVLAASLTAALDFDDVQAAKDAVSAFRVNRQVRWVGAYDENGLLVAGYSRAGLALPKSLEALADEGSWLRVLAPVEASGQLVGRVGLEVENESLTRRASRYIILAALLFLAALVTAVLGLSRASLRKANRQLEDRAEALAAANELLAEQMEVRANAEEQLRQAQKMQALGQLTGGIAHDFNNLLTVIQGSADMLTREGLADEKRMRFAQAIVQASANAASLTSQLLAFARRQPLRPENIDLNELIRSMRDLLDRTLGERVSVAISLGANGCPVEVDRAQMQSAILNIASNARDAMGGNGHLSISTRNYTEEGREMIAVDLTDNGSGMAPETRERIFEPFFTTKGTGKGTGLGLSQVYGFATQSGGNVEVRSEVGSGTTISVLLPCGEGSLPVIKAIREADENGAHGRILVVEDNVEVGSFAEALLSEQGHEVTLVTSAEQALQRIDEEIFDIVFSDVVMPGMGGLRLAEILAEKRPGLPVVLATGYSQEIAESGIQDRQVILKPYRLATLQDAIQIALTKRANLNEPKGE